MARTFLERGYAVDVIDSTDSRFLPRKEYAYFVDVGTNSEGRFHGLEGGMSGPGGGMNSPEAV